MIHGPQLKKDSNKIDFSISGVFCKANGESNLAELTIGGIETKDTYDKTPPSMPAVYKQPLTCLSYLHSNKNSPAMSAGIIQDWRALITFIALNHMNSYNLHFHKVDLKEIANWIKIKRELKSEGLVEKDGFKLEDINKKLEKVNEFLRLVALTIPDDEPVYFEKTNWNEFYIIYYDYRPVQLYNTNNVIGMLSPSTVVCPVESADFRNLVKGIKGGEKIEFVDYDNEFAKAYEKDEKVFGENCDRFFAKQFIGFSRTELKAVLEWIRITRQNCASGSVANRLFSDFETLLKGMYTDVSFSTQWSYSGSCFTYNAFIEKDEISQSGFAELNFSAKAVPLQREWNAMFVLFALQKLKRLKLSEMDSKIGYYNDKTEFVPLIFESKYTLAEPVSDIIQKLPPDFPIKFIPSQNEPEEYEYDVFTEFELECVIQWLSKLLDKPEAQESGQLSAYINDFIVTLKAKAYKTTVETLTPKNYKPWSPNRFIPDCMKITSSALKPFDFCVNERIAPFYEDFRGEGGDGNKVYGNMHVNVKEQWFRLLRVLTLRDLNSIKTDFIKADNLSEESSTFYKSNNYVKHAIRLKGREVAVTSMGMIFEVTNSELFDAKQYKSDDSKRFENLLFAHKLEELLAELKKDEQTIKKDDDDFKVIEKYISEETAELRKKIYPKPKRDTFEEDIEVIKKYFPLVTDESASPAFRYIASYIRDDFFAKKLLYRRSMESLNLETLDGKGDSIYAFRALDFDGNEVSLKKGMNENGSFLIPLSNHAANEITKAMAEQDSKSIDPDQTDVGRYGINSVKGYDVEDPDDPEAEYIVKIKLEGIDFEFVKAYNVGLDSIRLDLTDIPDILVWPNVEIQNWKAYFLSSVTSSSNSKNVTVELTDEVLDKYKLRDNYGVSGKGKTVKVKVTNLPPNNSVTLNIKATHITTFPHLVKITADGESGYLFIPSRNSTNDKDPSEDKSYLNTNQYTEETIGIDFGTTNTTAWIYDGEHGEFDAKLTNSASVVNRLICSNPVVHGVAALHSTGMMLYEAGIDRETKNTDPIISSTFLKYSHDNEGELGHPFLHGNIYRLDGEEVSSKEGILENRNSNGSNLVHGMKWDYSGSTDEEMILFLKEFALMCCRAAVEKKGAGNIKMRASFPSSMPLGRRRDFSDMWEVIVNDLNSLTGLNISDVDLYTESYCAGLVPQTSSSIYREQAKVEQGYICVDIGGGSTDISLFYDKKTPTAQLSIPFGGRLFLSGDGINKNMRLEITEFLEKLRFEIRRNHMDLHKNVKELPLLSDSLRKIDEYEKVIMYMRKLDFDSYGTPNFVLLTDLVIIGLYDAYKKIKLNGGFSNKGFAYVLKNLEPKSRKGKASSTSHYLARIKFGLSALAFFIGKAICKFEKEGKFVVRDGASGLPLNLYFAGNGSRILDWYMENDDDSDIVKKAVKEQGNGDISLAIFCEYIRLGYASTDDPRKLDVDALVNSKRFSIQIIPSNKPKLESAMGLSLADGESQILNDEDMDSLASININASIEIYKNDKAEFGKHLEKCFSKPEFADRRLSTKEIQELLKKDNKVIREKLIEKVNPSYSVTNVARQIFYFMGIFLRVSKNDATLLFPNTEIDGNGSFESGNNKSIFQKIQAQVEKLDLAIKADAGWISMPIADYTPYAILEYAKAVLNGTF